MKTKLIFPILAIFLLSFVAASSFDIEINSGQDSPSPITGGVVGARSSDTTVWVIIIVVFLIALLNIIIWKRNKKPSRKGSN